MPASYSASIQNHVKRLQTQRKLTPVIRTAKISNRGHPVFVCCGHAHLSPDTLRRRQWRCSDKDTLVERILKALKILGIGPMILTLQYESHLNSSNKAIYVHGRWLNRFYFTFLASHTSSVESFSSLEVRLCPAVLLSQVRRTLSRPGRKIRGNHLHKGRVGNWPQTLREISGNH